MCVQDKCALPRVALTACRYAYTVHFPLAFTRAVHVCVYVSVCLCLCTQKCVYAWACVGVSEWLVLTRAREHACAYLRVRVRDVCSPEAKLQKPQLRFAHRRVQE